MAKIALDLSQFKSAGVYTVEIDNSQRITVSTQTLKLVPGFSAVGPYNAPVFIRSTRDLNKFYGALDTKLERKGSFFHRSIQTSLLTSPVFAINLLKVDTISDSGTHINNDKVDLSVLSLNSNVDNPGMSDHMYMNFFNRERFWKADADYLQGVSNNAVGAGSNIDGPLFSVVNVGTKDLSFIIRKARTQGYGVTAKDWYGTETNIPYEWIRPYDLIEDYFIQVIAFEGDWSNYSNLSSDPYYSQYFNEKGLIPSEINNFINADQVNLVGSWVGTFIPDFKDHKGVEQYIETIVNGSTPLSGVMLNVNQDALDQLIWDENQWEIGDGSGSLPSTTLVDLIGHNLVNASTDVSTAFLSYNIDVSDNVLHQDIQISQTDTTGKIFSLDSSTDNLDVYVGAFVQSDSYAGNNVTRITNKYWDASANSNAGGYVLETLSPIAGYESTATSVKLQKNLEDPSINQAYTMLPLKGLHIRNSHLPGFDTNGQSNAESGVKKIYGMLHDKGILRGLTNPDMINYRYVIDTMAFGLQSQMGGKSYLSSLAKKRGKCTAILNAPSIKQFAASQNPYFADTFVAGVDPMPIFNTQYIPEGGNPDMPRSFKFSLPSEDMGSKYCGVFGPFLKYSINGKLINVPPAADVCNAYARKFLGGDPYAIVANKNGVLANPNLAGVEYMIDKEDRDYLEPMGYNSIIERASSTQIMIYANATAYQAVKSDYNNLHVRELLNTLELQIDEILQYYVFDFNNAVTRLNIINSIAPILENAKGAGALQKYELVMDDSNNNASIIADGFGIVDIGLWVTGALTKIVARFTVNSDGGVSSGGFAG